MPFLPPLPLKCTSVCRKKINNYIHTRYLINYFLIHISSMKTCGRSGIVAEERCFLLKKIGGAIAQKGTFHYLYIVLPFGRVFAMTCMNHRDGVMVSSRWSGEEGPLVRENAL